jgi:Ca2+-binding EF-hand superfamily protein
MTPAAPKCGPLRGKLNQKPSPRKSTFVYRQHQPSKKKLVIRPPVSVDKFVYGLENILIPRVAQSIITSPIRLVSKECEQAYTSLDDARNSSIFLTKESSLASKNTHLSRKSLSPRMEQISKPLPHRSRHKEIHVRPLIPSKSPQLAYYSEEKRERINFREAIGKCLPKNNHDLEGESAYLALEFSKRSKNSFREKSNSRFQASVRIGEPFAVKKHLSSSFINPSTSPSSVSICKELSQVKIRYEPYKHLESSQFFIAQKTGSQSTLNKEWDNYDESPSMDQQNMNDSSYTMKQLDKVEAFINENEAKWLPSNALDFLTEERMAKKLLSQINDNPLYDTIFENYRPTAKPGSEADACRSRSLARMGLLVDIKKLKVKKLAQKWRSITKANIKETHSDRSIDKKCHVGEPKVTQKIDQFNSNISDPVDYIEHEQTAKEDNDDFTFEHNVLRVVKEAILDKQRTHDGYTIRNTRLFFESLDKNHSGYLSVEEMQKGLHGLDLGMTSEQVHDLMNYIHFDENNESGEVSWDEFVKALHDVRPFEPPHVKRHSTTASHFVLPTEAISPELLKELNVDIANIGQRDEENSLNALKDYYVNEGLNRFHMGRLLKAIKRQEEKIQENNEAEKWSEYMKEKSNGMKQDQIQVQQQKDIEENFDGDYEAWIVKQHIIQRDHVRTPNLQEKKRIDQKIPIIHAIRTILEHKRSLFNHTIEDTRSFFKSLDRNQSGRLTREEIAHGLHRLGVVCVSKDVDDLMKLFHSKDGRFDEDRSDGVCYEDLVLTLHGRYDAMYDVKMAELHNESSVQIDVNKKNDA